MFFKHGGGRGRRHEQAAREFANVREKSTKTFQNNRLAIRERKRRFASER
jgi:hypothetical protein